MYKVIHSFTDIEDNGCKYEVGANYPRHGLIVSERRLRELSGSFNRQGKPLIKFVKDEEQKVVLEEAPKKRGRKPNNQ